jgi:NAD(P)-dependent dehydrogenase (short-subunit alcohol dehydrogenase family)
MGRLEGKVALITGGASGIGEGTVRLFVEEGARCVIADIQDDRGRALEAEMKGAAIYTRTDVTIEDDVRGAVIAAVKTFGHLDVIFNNAGFLGVTGPIEATPIDEYDLTMNVLLRGPMLGMKHAAPVMKAQGSGSIISTASIAGLTAGESTHIYGTAKAAVVHLTKSVALELAPHNVRVNAICPGAIVTGLVLGGIPNTPQAEEGVKAAFKRFQPMPHTGMPEDIARAALWLASDDSSFVTGQAIAVDGGYTAGKPWDRWADPFKTHTPMKSQPTP